MPDTKKVLVECTLKNREKPVVGERVFFTDNKGITDTVMVDENDEVHEVISARIVDTPTEPTVEEMLEALKGVGIQVIPFQVGTSVIDGRRVDMNISLEAIEQDVEALTRAYNELKAKEALERGKK